MKTTKMYCIFFYTVFVITTIQVECRPIPGAKKSCDGQEKVKRIYNDSSMTIRLFKKFDKLSTEPVMNDMNTNVNPNINKMLIFMNDKNEIPDKEGNKSKGPNNNINKEKMNSTFTCRTNDIFKLNKGLNENKETYNLSYPSVNIQESLFSREGLEKENIVYTTRKTKFIPILNNLNTDQMSTVDSATIMKESIDVTTTTEDLEDVLLNECYPDTDVPVTTDRPVRDDRQRIFDEERNNSIKVNFEFVTIKQKDKVNNEAIPDPSHRIDVCKSKGNNNKNNKEEVHSKFTSRGNEKFLLNKSLLKNNDNHNSAYPSINRQESLFSRVRIEKQKIYSTRKTKFNPILSNLFTDQISTVDSSMIMKESIDTTTTTEDLDDLLLTECYPDTDEPVTTDRLVRDRQHILDDEENNSIEVDSRNLPLHQPNVNTDYEKLNAKRFGINNEGDYGLTERINGKPGFEKNPNLPLTSSCTLNS